MAGPRGAAGASRSLLLLLLAAPLLAQACSSESDSGDAEAGATALAGSGSTGGNPASGGTGSNSGGASSEGGAGVTVGNGGAVEAGAGGQGSAGGATNAGGAGGAGNTVGGGSAQGGAPATEDCGNASDDDGDGAIDCADGDCDLAAACANKEHCTGLVDDDGDGDVDCADGDCASAAACPPVPQGWMCVHERFNEHAFGVSNAGCDCDCGAHDPDCDLSPALPLGCYTAVAKLGQACVSDHCTPPDTWTCPDAMYNQENQGAPNPTCDCTCGDGDPDCANWDLPITACAADEFCSVGGICVPEDPQPPAVPPGWTCDPFQFDETNQPLAFVWCDCDCGAHDPDCDVPDVDMLCGESFPEPHTTCVADVCVHPVWTCDPGLFDQQGQGVPNPTCDCNCGIEDPDCSGPAPQAGCAAGELCRNAACVPTTWSCFPGFFYDGECDCGCGAVDLDCADSTAASCQYCLMGGSCGDGPCPANIDPNDNSTCI